MSDFLTLSGAELKRFMADPVVWAADTHWDDTLILVDGRNADEHQILLDDVADVARIEVESGYLVEPQPGVPDDLVEAIQWWREKQSTVTYIVTVPRHDVEEFERNLNFMGLKINKG